MSRAAECARLLDQVEARLATISKKLDSLGNINATLMRTEAMIEEQLAWERAHQLDDEPVETGRHEVPMMAGQLIVDVSYPCVYLELGQGPARRRIVVWSTEVGEDSAPHPLPVEMFLDWMRAGS